MAIGTDSFLRFRYARRFGHLGDSCIGCERKDSLCLGPPQLLPTCLTPHPRSARHKRYLRLGLSRGRIWVGMSYEEAEVQQHREGGWTSGTGGKCWKRKAYGPATQNPAQHPQRMGGSRCGVGCERCGTCPHPRKGGRAAPTDHSCRASQGRTLRTPGARRQGHARRSSRARKDQSDPFTSTLCVHRHCPGQTGKPQ